MKKSMITSIALLMLVTTSVVAQHQPSLSEKNLNVFNLLVFKAVDLSYEQYIDEEASWGVSLLLSLEGEDRLDGYDPYYNESFAFTPFYRLYFGKAPYSGFFVEGFANYSYGKRQDWDYTTMDDYYNYTSSITSYNSLVAGFALGKKWMTKRRISFTLFGGLGRALITDNGFGFFPRVGISIGKRK